MRLPRTRRGLQLAALLLVVLSVSCVLDPARAQESTPDTAATPAAAPTLEPPPEAGASAPTAAPVSAEPTQGLPAGAPAPTAAGAPATPNAIGAPHQTQLSDLRARGTQSTWLQRLQSFVGLFGLLLIAFLLSNNRSAIDFRVVFWGTALQVIFAVLILATSPGQAVFSWLNDAVVVLLSFTSEAHPSCSGISSTTTVLSGPRWAIPTMGPILPQNQTGWANTGSFFAFNILPTIIFFSSLMTIMYHVGVMQHVVNFFTRIMQSTMRTSGSETLSAAANIFLGQTEAPLCVKPYVPTMTKSELMAVMVGGFANTAGGVLAAYVGMLKGKFPDIAGHLISVSVMSAPASLVIAKIMFPETEQSLTRGRVKMNVEKIDANAIDAAARGAGEGLTLALNVAAMLIAFIALVAALNWGINSIGVLIGFPQLSLEFLFGYLFWPIAWLMGIPAQDCSLAGQLLGVKTVLNEFVAYLRLSDLLQGPTQPMTDRSLIIVTYALCGFANFSSIAIQIGGIAGMAPNRRSDLARLGLRAMVGGSIATFMCAAIAGLLI